MPPGLLDIYFLPGQGRAPGSITAFIDVVQFFTYNRYTAEDPLPSDLILKLDAFNVQNRTANSAVSDIDFTQPSRTFTDLDLTFTRFTREDDFGNQQSFNGEIHKLLGNFLITAYKGRVTSVQLKMHDAMVDQVTNGGIVTDLNFNTTAFVNENTNPETGKVTGQLSDYICFDISGVPNKPKLASPSVAGQDAQKVFMSGDGYALSVKDPLGVNGSAGVFEALTKFGTFEGIFRPEESAVTHIKSYELKQADPSQVPALRLITALKGIYRDLGQVVSNLKAFEFITLPKTGDGPKQEIAIVQRNVGTGAITQMWFGTADFSTKSFRVYPIRNVQPASTAGELTGSFTTFANQNGTAVPSAGTDWWQAVREGTFKFNGAPVGIPAANRTGRFLVFRA